MFERCFDGIAGHYDIELPGKKVCWNSNESVVRLNRHSHAAAFLPASRSKKHYDASFAACILGGNEAMEPGKRNVSTMVNGNLLICIFL